MERSHSASPNTTTTPVDTHATRAIKAAVAAVITAAIAGATAGLAGCNPREVADSRLGQAPVEHIEFRVGQNRNLDLLFVIDNSRSMAGEQQSLVTNFDSLIAQLEAIEGGLPSVHIGVVSTDLGTAPHGVCQTGDAGALQAAPRTPGCSPPDGLFIRDLEREDGSRDRNYEGSLQDAFSCIARLGDQGCGFEQPLEAMRRALDPALTPQNAGFLRKDARLAVIFITDEDDCSVIDPALFDEARGDLGPLHSFRCFEYGVRCDAADVRPFGEYDGCVPDDESALVRDVTSYVELLAGLKAFPEDDVVVGAIMGESLAPGAPVVVEQDPDFPAGVGRVRPSCVLPDAETGDDDGATPPLRLQAFLEAFPRHQQTSICNQDLSGALAALGDLVAPEHGAACLQGALAGGPDAIEAACVVSEIRSPLSPDRQERAIPRCTDPGDPQASARLPCYTALVAPACDTETGLELRVHYASGEIVPDQTRVAIQCEVE